jgi:hypothetical protein
MRRWDRLVDAYVEEYGARGLSPQSVAYTRARLDRWGRWLKGRRPRISIERIDAEQLTRYIASCSSFRAKATVYATLSTMRGFGDYLVRVVRQNFSRGPKRGGSWWSRQTILSSIEQEDSGGGPTRVRVERTCIKDGSKIDPDYAARL